MHGTVDLLLLHDMQRAIKLFCLWKLPNILPIVKVVSMSGILTISFLKTPPIETMGWGWPKLPLQMWILHSFDSIAHGAIH